jgi:Family of unknown function (DUF6361)
MSYFAWLDYSEHDRRVALDVIDKFREHETRDELGLAAVRDGFADLFFPGTGTVQTRPRYFLFVPWLYLRLEARKVPSAEVRAKARKLELALVETLLADADGDGVIGRLARQRLKRLPSSIYWQGLGALGIRLYPGSQEQYHRSLDRFYRSGALALRAEDGELLDRARARNWHPALPEPPENFPDAATLDLTAEEAEFLAERVAVAAPESLLRHLADRGDALDDVELPWDVVQELPAALRAQLEHARNFSEVMHGAALLYNLMLAELRGWPELINDYAAALDEWREMMQERRDAHAAWDRAGFWETVRSTQANVTPATRTFVDHWLTLALAPGGEDPAGSDVARVLVTERERQLKRGQARLLNRRALELWQGASGAGRLNYRWPVARRMLADMRAALDGEAAHA